MTRTALYVVLSIGLLGLTPNEAFAQGAQMRGWGEGRVMFQGESKEALLVAWTKGEEQHFLRIEVGDRVLQIEVTSEQGNEAWGFLGPIRPWAGEAEEDDTLCEEGICGCKLRSEDDTNMTGSCDVPMEGAIQKLTFQFSVHK